MDANKTKDLRTMKYVYLILEKPFKGLILGQYYQTRDTDMILNDYIMSRCR